MAPTHTVTAHLCKQFYTSWRQTRQPDAANASSPPTPRTAFQFRRAPSPEAKRSMDSDRGSDAGSPPISRQPSNSSWKSWR